MRAARVALHLVHGSVFTAFVFSRLPPAQRTAWVRYWSARLLHILAVRLKTSGTPARGAAPAMLVANHVSWLDIYALNAVRPARFVAKAEIRRWPLIGALARRTGTVFIERARRRGIPHLNAQLSALLREGETIALFPEGTTSGGEAVLPFSGSLLQPAIECNAHLQAVAICYSRADGSPCSEAGFTGDQTLLASIWQVLAQPAIHAHLQFLPAVACAGRHRRELAREARDNIFHALEMSAAKARAVEHNAAPVYQPARALLGSQPRV